MRYFNSIGFTGTRYDITTEQRHSLHRLISALDFNYTHSGDCIGADAWFVAIVGKLKPTAYQYGHPPLKREFRAFCKEYDFVCSAKDYLARNRDIVYESDVVIACPKSSENALRSGTWFTVRCARRSLKPVIIILPNGTVKCERCEGAFCVVDEMSEFTEKQ